MDFIVKLQHRRERHADGQSTLSPSQGNQETEPRCCSGHGPASELRRQAQKFCAHITMPSSCACTRQPRSQGCGGKHQQPFQQPLQTAPRQWVDIPPEPNLLRSSSGASWQLPDHGSTTSSSLPRKPAPKHSGGPSHTAPPKPSLTHRWQVFRRPLLSPKPLITTAGQCVICMF